MTGRVALIVHGDPSVRRMLSDALAMFSPGYHVTTASDLDRATEWLAVLDPDLVVLEGGGTESETLSDWASTNELDASKLLLLMSPSQQAPIQGAAIVESPSHLPALMGAVRRLAATPAPGGQTAPAKLEPGTAEGIR